MKGIKLIIKSLKFYKKQHLAVLFGTIISTAVLTGALITGDSVKFSLKQLVEDRLGKTEYVLQSGERFFRTELGNDLATSTNTETIAITILNGVSTNPENEKRISRTQVLAVNNDFWKFSQKTNISLKDEETILSEKTADRLGVEVGDEIVLRVENIDVIPVNSPFSDEETPSVAFRLTVAGIAGKAELGLFSLKSNQVSPYNIFISQEYLNEKLDLPGLSNTILIANNNDSYITPEILNEKLKETWKLKDAGIEVEKSFKTGKYELTSDRIFIDKQISDACVNYHKETEGIVSYLVNSIKCRDSITPYSFVSAINIDKYNNLNDNEIVINKWLADDLNAKPGDTIELEYYIINPLQNLSEERCSFIVKEIIPTRDSIADRTLMPKFPGFEKAVSCVDWSTNIPIDLDRIRDKDEDFWNQYKGTPKALISLNKGIELWDNKFGYYTALRFKSDKDKEQVERDILNVLQPSDLNLVFIPAKQEGLMSAGNGVDFGELFLSLSFFVIVAAILLIVLLYSMHIKSREKELGILLSLGFRRRKIVNNIVYETTFVVLIGGLIGMFTGVLYNMALMEAINSVWNDIIRTKMLSIDINIPTLIKGALAGVESTLITIYFYTLFKLKKTPVTILNSNFSNNKFALRKTGVDLMIVLISFISSISIVVYSILTDIINNSGLFLTAGGLFLIGCYAFFSFYMKRKIRTTRNNSLRIGAIVTKNIARNLSRSLTIIILLSLGTFIVLITGANRKTFHDSENLRHSGTGGYAFWAETSVPVTYDLNSRQADLMLAYGDAFEDVSFNLMSSLPGDDASCLNLNQVQKPGILGLDPAVLDKRESFSFAKLLPEVNSDSAWLELNKYHGSNIIPAYADQTVIQWGIMKKVGDTLNYLNEKGKEIKLVLIGGLNASIFQGNILISDKNFYKHFPSSGGSKTMLIDCPREKQEKVYELLNEEFKDYGMEISNTSQRLSQFYSVTNTYLSVFMILGGLGVLIATIGLGIIIYRNLLDRKQELALLKASGYSGGLIKKLILQENIVLILTGTIIGIASAIIGILPSILSPSFNIPEKFVFILIAIILINSMIWAYYPVVKILKKGIINSLRNE